MRHRAGEGPPRTDAADVVGAIVTAGDRPSAASRSRREAYTLHARWIVPVGSPPIESGWVRIDRGRITAIGRRSVPGMGSSASIVDFGDAIILPGLVNAHTHLEFSDLACPLAADGGLPGWIAGVVALRRARPTGTDADAHLEQSLRLGLAECLTHGVTTVGDIATRIPACGFPSVGPRIRVYREALGLSFNGATAPGSVVSDLDRLGRVAGISPHAPYTVSKSLGRALLAAARRRDLPVTMHLAESMAELAYVTAGSGPLRDLLASLGAWPADRVAPVLPPSEWIGRLARCRRGSVVHGTFLGDAPDATALHRLARHRDRLGVVVCPRTTRLLSGRLPPAERFLAAGIRVAIGTDSRASNPDLSVLAEARELAGAGIASAARAIRMMTVDAAWALAYEDRAGVIAVGRPADLAVLTPAGSAGDPFEAALRHDTKVAATFRGGRLLHGRLPLD
jgi:cytosine/adenosine deaminase-related metal-dependent hydrolase